MLTRPAKLQLAGLLTVLATTSWSQAQETPPADSGSDSAGDSPTKEQCLEAHRQSQEARQSKDLLRARQLANECANLACPGIIIEDCARWLNELNESTPSVIFDIRVDGDPNQQARVWADDKEIENWTEGEALLMDPGEHAFRAVLPSHEPITQKMVLAEGMRYRTVRFDFATEQGASSAPASSSNTTAPPQLDSNSTTRPVPKAVYPLLGVGVLGLGGFIGFGLAGQSKESSLEDSCEPNCSNSDLKPMKQLYLVGDISLGVGIVGLVGAGLVYVTRPERPRTASRVGFVPLRNGGMATVTWKGM